MSKEEATTSSSIKDTVLSLFKSRSNGKASDDGEAGPSKHQVTEGFPSIKKSFNTMMTYFGVSMNNSTNIVYNINCTRDPTNVTMDESSIIVQRTVTKEVFPYDKEIIKLIWKHLSFEDKTDCTLVCNRFNDIISNMNCFRLVVKSKRSKLQIIPTVSRHYKKLDIQGYRFNCLPPAMHKMLKHLSQSVTDLTLDCCEFDIIALSKFLCEFPFLESLKLNVFITIYSFCMIPEEELPKLLQLKDFNIKSNDKFNEILDITESASNIQSLTLFDAIFNEHLIVYLTKYKNTLTTLSITKCIVETSFMTNLNSLHFGSNVKISPVNFKTFYYLNKLRKLELIDINNEVLGILKKEWVKQLKECTITFNYKQVFDVERYFYEGFYKHFTVYKRESFATRPSDDRKDYYISLEKLNKKMIEYFEPLSLNPTVDDINNNMCYFKITPITKTEDFLMNRRDNSIIPSSILQDILIGRAKEKANKRKNAAKKFKFQYDNACEREYRKWCFWDEEWCIEYYFLYRENDEWWNYDNECEKVYSKYYEKYNKLWDEYDLLKDYEDWCTWNQEWYEEYYKCYKRDDLWWEDCDDWKEEYFEWWEGDQEWKKQYYKCYKRKYEWWEICEDWQHEYDDWLDGYHEWCKEYYNWYREYYNYNKEYEDLRESRGARVKVWCRDYTNWYRVYRKYNNNYHKWSTMNQLLRRNYEDRIRRFNDNVIDYYEWCRENNKWGKKYREKSRYYESFRRYNTYDKVYGAWCDEYGELFLEDNTRFDVTQHKHTIGY